MAWAVAPLILMLEHVGNLVVSLRIQVGNSREDAGWYLIKRGAKEKGCNEEIPRICMETAKMEAFQGATRRNKQDGTNALANEVLLNNLNFYEAMKIV